MPSSPTVSPDQSDASASHAMPTFSKPGVLVRSCPALSPMPLPVVQAQYSRALVLKY